MKVQESTKDEVCPMEDPSIDEKKHVFDKQELFSWIKTLVLAFLIAFGINNYIIVNATIPTGSMETTIMTGDRVVANRWSYFQSIPKRGDIIIFRYPDDEQVLYVKRVIGIPGDTIEIANGKVYINHSTEPLIEPYMNEFMEGEFGPYEVPAESYFVMGDNRNNSLDSRFWSNTFVKKDKILGKVVFRYFPRLQWLAGTSK